MRDSSRRADLLSSVPTLRLRGAAIPSVILVAVFLLALEGCGSSNHTNVSTVYVSVQEFEPRAGVSLDAAKNVTSQFERLLVQSGRIMIVDRKQLVAKTRASLKEYDGDSGILPARKLIYGCLGKLSAQSYSLTVKVVDVETSHIDVAISRTHDGNVTSSSNQFLSAIVQDILTALDKPATE